uniref:Uncharacterized protein n=1 Tax=Glossina austeni TaxID=7395 RepID=A0A1A9UTB6_GLOAU
MIADEDVVHNAPNRLSMHSGKQASSHVHEKEVEFDSSMSALDQCMINFIHNSSSLLRGPYVYGETGCVFAIAVVFNGRTFGNRNLTPKTKFHYLSCPCNSIELKLNLGKFFLVKNSPADEIIKKSKICLKPLWQCHENR